MNTYQQVELPSGVIGTMDKERTILSSKLYGTLNELRYEMQVQSLSKSSLLLQPVFSPTGLSSFKAPCFSNETVYWPQVLLTFAYH
ncbi:unnamed protein product [Didymodactylos carnosus]|uniref:Uncharacterized protein n=1 Tax=Didymodactylos carnosus TaxID=1234261 RepID=A0A814CQN9_9BILA|nr:unnamed protein product [Didymodactylos carnosus]CAF3721705.1 unnamed protein product [Didymodactylos carnosus]